MMAKMRLHQNHPRGKRYAIVRGEGDRMEYWNGKQEMWIPASKIHGGSASNPKASYFSGEMAIKTLQILRNREERNP
jgi:hypothetical protein